MHCARTLPGSAELGKQGGRRRALVAGTQTHAPPWPGLPGRSAAAQAYVYGLPERCQRANMRCWPQGPPPCWPTPLGRPWPPDAAAGEVDERGCRATIGGSPNWGNWPREGAFPVQAGGGRHETSRPPAAPSAPHLSPQVPSNSAANAMSSAPDAGGTSGKSSTASQPPQVSLWAAWSWHWWTDAQGRTTLWQQQLSPPPPAGRVAEPRQPTLLFHPYAGCGPGQRQHVGHQRLRSHAAGEGARYSRVRACRALAAQRATGA